MTVPWLKMLTFTIMLCCRHLEAYFFNANNRRLSIDLQMVWLVLSSFVSKTVNRKNGADKLTFRSQRSCTNWLTDRPQRNVGLTDLCENLSSRTSILAWIPWSNFWPRFRGLFLHLLRDWRLRLRSFSSSSTSTDPWPRWRWRFCSFSFSSTWTSSNSSSSVSVVTWVLLWRFAFMISGEQLGFGGVGLFLGGGGTNLGKCDRTWTVPPLVTRSMFHIYMWNLLSQKNCMYTIFQ